MGNNEKKFSKQNHSSSYLQHTWRKFWHKNLQPHPWKSEKNIENCKKKVIRCKKAEKTQSANGRANWCITETETSCGSQLPPNPYLPSIASSSDGMADLFPSICCTQWHINNSRNCLDVIVLAFECVVCVCVGLFRLHKTERSAIERTNMKTVKLKWYTLATIR